ncbi:T9SS type A sorting domain-containing protein [bacterium SCSIO 12741]|nr:T9SS type A sorting domain-containing protein [bacterium SCSIO 12741]
MNRIIERVGVGLLICLMSNSLWAQFQVDRVGDLPEAVSNNAVCEGFINGEAYLYSFGGIDTSKKYSGIHLRSFRFNTQTGLAERIPDLPDTLGKVAAAASRIGDVIYIAGGYHVYANGNERSSNKMHRYQISTNSFLPDGQNMPVATDDHVQAVWKDSLIYLITGWSHSGNIPLVQIYDAKNDSWTAGSNVPNNHDYKSFGSSGIIIGDTIYYYGGASGSAGFAAQNQLRMGVINPSDPTQITWSISTPDSNEYGYRMACARLENKVLWIGGSEVTYNYNGIAYNGSGGVAPINRYIYITHPDQIWIKDQISVPMDLRGVADVGMGVFYLAGGMEEDQKVTSAVHQLRWNHLNLPDLETVAQQLTLYPQPARNQITLNWKQEIIKPWKVKLYHSSGRLLEERNMNQETMIWKLNYSPGIYYFLLNDGESTISKRFVLSE